MMESSKIYTNQKCIERSDQLLVRLIDNLVKICVAMDKKNICVILTGLPLIQSS
jgi:hypothetical protein